MDATNVLNADEKPIKALLVEDDVISQHLTCKLLRSFKVVTDIAISGRRALASLSSIKYDLILMDVNLPDTNGIYIVSQTQNEEHINHNTPVVMLSGIKQKQTITDALKHGAKGYVVKPLTKATVAKIIQKHIG